MPSLLLASTAAASTASSAPLYSFESAIALLTLTVMEIVLGIDNIVFIAIITSRLPEAQRPRARRVGLALAMIMRIALLLTIGWMMGLEAGLFELSTLMPTAALAQWMREQHEVNAVSWRDLILLAGGLFLLWTSVREIHHKIEGGEQEAESGNIPQRVTVAGVLVRIAIMDMIFSLDSVITAVGMAQHIPIMVAAVVLAVGVMIAFANQISDFVQTHPTVKMLALAFLLLIATVLVSEAVGKPINKGYVYFAMTFSLGVEFLNLRMSTKRLRPSAGEGETGLLRRPDA
ncbi:TerC family protein [Roseimaritima ulvae]|uniref:Integral membrane protein TerC family protein n=1 Tax=Roseimaritima ulvae TaxID=980254 RepID=A0A5B9R1F0_9BACT|nr:TerC family protein [Roseimaritima ulvae]QEG40143.1 Integral membrane protein TerC family protein [Roseimaritima ulvae]